MSAERILVLIILGALAIILVVFAIVPNDGDAATPCHVGKGVPSAQPLPASPIGKGYRP